MRKFVEGPVDRLQCEIHRYSKGISRVRWPSLGGKEHIWFTCTLWHTAGFFTITSFLRVTPATTIRSRPCTVSLPWTTRPLTSQWSGIYSGTAGTEPICFSYSSSSGQTEGSGVAVKGIARGDASLTVPLTNVSSEGTFHVFYPRTPTQWEPGHRTACHDQELNPRVVCVAERFYPWDMEIDLFKEISSGQWPEKLENATYYSRHKNNDSTYSLSAFVGLQPSPEES
ncbi:unnamed protein product, partial [Coregonus sp. 'balchen']